MAQGEGHIPNCFVIMPISDVDGYEPGHFGRVYEFIIRPACKSAGFTPVRADEVQVTNYIVVDILRKILDAEMVVCDLSGRNANVLYELGIRQAFNRPVTLMRDSRTPRIFDIQGLRDLEYDETLRIDKINLAVESLTNLLRNTSKLDKAEVNSIIQLLGVTPAQVPSVEVSTDTSLLLNAISDLGKRLSRLEDLRRTDTVEAPARVPTSIVMLNNGLMLMRGFRVKHPDYGEGVISSVSSDGVTVHFDNRLVVPFSTGSEEIEKLSYALTKAG